MRAKLTIAVVSLSCLLVLSCGNLSEAVRVQRELAQQPEVDVTAVGPFDVPTSADDPPVEERFRNIRVLRGLPSSQLYPVMALMANSLGVTCTYCHSQHYEEEGRREKDIARDMILMTRAINRTQFQGQPVVSCNSCHNGTAYPNPVPQIARAGWHSLLSIDEYSPLPDVDSIYEQHLDQMGGGELLGGLRGKGLLLLVGGLDQESAGDFELTMSDESVEIRSDALFPPDFETSLARYRFGRLNLASIYEEPMAVRTETIEGAERVVVVAQVSDEVPERLTFDLSTGLLVLVHGGTPTELGYVPFEISFLDYRDVAGVPTPHTVRWARGDFQVTLQFSEFSE